MFLVSRVHHRLKLSHLVLASTLLTIPKGMAATDTVNVVVDVTKNPPAGDSLEIVSPGAINRTGNNSAITVTNDNVVVNVNQTVGNGGIALKTVGTSDLLVITGKNADVNINAGARVSSAEQVIQVLAGATGTTIDNAGQLNSVANKDIIDIQEDLTNVLNLSGGKIEAQGNGVAISAQSGAVISNALGGTIQSSAGDAIQYLGAGPSFFDVLNEGVLQSTNGGSAIFVSGKSTSSIENLNQGVISSTIPAALDIQNDVSFIKNNFGAQIISTAGEGISINVNPLTTNIINDGAIDTDLGAAISITSNLTGNITNQGTLTTKQTHALLINADISGDVQNLGGTIQATDANTAGSAIEIGNASIGGKLLNTGTLSSANTKALNVSNAGAKVVGGIFNSGTITSPAGIPSVDLATSTNAIVFHQTAGSISGDVLLSKGANGNSVFEMSGGTIGGDVVAATGAGNNNVLNISGGVINGDLTLGDQGDVLNISGGTINGVIQGGAPAPDTLNITDSFSSSNQIKGIKTVIVANPGTQFNVNDSVTDIDTNLTLGADTTLVIGDTISGTGTVVNDGHIEIQSNGNLNVGSAVNSITNQNAGTITIQSGGKIQTTGDVTHSNGTLTIHAGGELLANDLIQNFGNSENLVIELSDAANFGKVTLNQGALPGIFTNLTNSNIELALEGNGFIQDKDTFDILTSDNAIIADGSQFFPPPSLSLSFEKSIDGGNKVITVSASRVPFLSLTDRTLVKPVAFALDQLGPTTTDRGILQIIGQLDTLSTKTTLENALATLVPQVDHGLIQNSRNTVRGAFNAIGDRLVNIQAQLDEFGLSNGDNALPWQFWGTAFAAISDQDGRDDIEGYESDITGLIFGIDKQLNPKMWVGGALSFSQGDAEAKTQAQKRTDFTNFQTSLYLLYDYLSPWYLEVFLGLGVHNYSTERQIAVGSLMHTAFAEFDGLQFSSKVQVGYVFDRAGYTITPIANFFYSHLDLDNYTEKGASTIGLAVIQDSVNFFEVGLGVKIASRNEYVEANYKPEFRLFAFQEFSPDPHVTQASFIGDGSVRFFTQGARPSKRTYNAGVGLTAFRYNGAQVTLDYDVYLKKSFQSHLGQIKFLYEWA